MSLRTVAPCPASCSGAMYAGVPASSVTAASSSTATARPKSVIRTRPRPSTMMFAGFRSRCSTPRSCAAASPATSWRVRSSAFSFDRYPIRAISDASSVHTATYTHHVNAEPFLSEIARLLGDLHFDAVLIGNAAAALQGAPVTTLAFDFMFRDTPVNRRKLKALATALGATILRPYYPAADLFRVVRQDGLQIDFLATIHGVRSFAGLRDRSTSVTL